MSANSFVAGNPVLNTTVAEGHRLLGLITKAGLGTGVLYANPIAGAGSAAGGLIPEAQFAANGVPTDGTRIYLQVMIPGPKFPDAYDVAEVLKLVDGGKPLAQALS
jgi:hypothetical protein